MDARRHEAQLTLIPNALSPDQLLAIRAAQAGDWSLADRMELDWLHRNGARPWRGELMEDSEDDIASLDSLDEGCENAVPVHLRRGDCGLIVSWVVAVDDKEMEPCPHRDAVARDECPYCQGLAWRAALDPYLPKPPAPTPLFLVQADIDGQLIRRLPVGERLW